MDVCGSMFLRRMLLAAGAIVIRATIVIEVLRR